MKLDQSLRVFFKISKKTDEKAYMSEKKDKPFLEESSQELSLEDKDKSKESQIQKKGESVFHLDSLFDYETSKTKNGEDEVHLEDEVIEEENHGLEKHEELEDMNLELDEKYVIENKSEDLSEIKENKESLKVDEKQDDLEAQSLELHENDLQFNEEEKEKTLEDKNETPIELSSLDQPNLEEQLTSEPAQEEKEEEQQQQENNHIEIDDFKPSKKSHHEKLALSEKDESVPEKEVTQKIDSDLVSLSSDDLDQIFDKTKVMNEKKESLKEDLSEDSLSSFDSLSEKQDDAKKSQKLSEEDMKKDPLLFQSENLSIAQRRISDLEGEVESLRLNIEKLVAAGETLKRRNGKLLSLHQELKEKLENSESTSEKERQLLKSSILGKDKMIEDLRLKNSEMNMRVSLSVKKIRIRERELENLLEISKREKEALLRDKNDIILDLKKKIENDEIDLNNFRLQSKQLNEKIQEKTSLLLRIQKALKLSLAMIESSGHGKDHLELMSYENEVTHNEITHNEEVTALEEEEEEEEVMVQGDEKIDLEKENTNLKKVSGEDGRE